jgi:hypothetical protein
MPGKWAEARLGLCIFFLPEGWQALSITRKNRWSWEPKIEKNVFREFGLCYTYLESIVENKYLVSSMQRVHF